MFHFLLFFCFFFCLFLQNSQENNLSESIFDKVVGLQLATLLKRDPTQVFSCEFCEFIKIFAKHLECPFLKLKVLLVSIEHLFLNLRYSMGVILRILKGTDNYSFIFFFLLLLVLFIKFIASIQLLKVGLSPSKKYCFNTIALICFNDSPLKMIKNAFYFILKDFFVLDFLVMQKNRLDQKDKFSFKIYDATASSSENCITHIVQYLTK